MAIKTYGSLHFNPDKNKWIMPTLQPHVCIRLKQLFQSIKKTHTDNFSFENRDEVCADLEWFIARYPVQISKKDLDKLKKGRESFTQRVNELEAILLSNTQLEPLQLQEGLRARVMFTGSESPAHKKNAKKAFVNKETKLIIMSLRSGIGLDGLQSVCSFVVFGELDWSPKVHDQVIARIDREGQEKPVTAVFITTDYGSDPPMVSLLGLKASLQHNIINPNHAVEEVHTDDSRIKVMATQFLKSFEKAEA